MSGNGLIVAFFALAFLAFCLTAVALYALSRDKDDAADKSISGLTDLRLSSISRPKQEDTPAQDEPTETDSE